MDRYQRLARERARSGQDWLKPTDLKYLEVGDVLVDRHGHDWTVSRAEKLNGEPDVQVTWEHVDRWLTDATCAFLRFKYDRNGLS